MGTAWRSVCAVAALVAMFLLAMPASPRVSGITFEEVNKKFGIESKWTDLRKKEEWKKYKGKCVQWTGELAYLEQGWLGGISIGFKHLPYTLTYDVLISAPRSEKDRLMHLEQGTRYRYKATLDDYGVILPITADWGCE